MKKRIPFKEAIEKNINGEIFTKAGHRISDFHQMQGIGYCGIVYPTGKKPDIISKPSIITWNEKGLYEYDLHLHLEVEYNAPDEVQWHLIYQEPTTGECYTPEIYGYPSEDHALGAWERKLEEGFGNHIIGISKVKFTNTNK